MPGVPNPDFPNAKTISLSAGQWSSHHAASVCFYFSPGSTRHRLSSAPQAPGTPPTSLRRNATLHRWDTNPCGSSERSPQLNLRYPLSKDFPGHKFRSGGCPKHSCLSVVSLQAERMAEQGPPSHRSLCKSTATTQDTGRAAEPVAFRVYRQALVLPRTHSYLCSPLGSLFTPSLTGTCFAHSMQSTRDQDQGTISTKEASETCLGREFLPYVLCRLDLQEFSYGL